jgi:hypothetical protein
LSHENRPWRQRLRDGWRRAFALDSPHGPLTEDDHKLLDRLAGKIVGRRMTAPALLFLGSVSPLSSLGSQAMTFLRPFLVGPFNQADYDRMTKILDRREGIAALMEAVESAEASRKEAAR